MRMTASSEVFGTGTEFNGNLPPVRLNFTPQERLALKAFLSSLTDHTFIQDERFANPFTTP